MDQVWYRYNLEAGHHYHQHQRHHHHHHNMQASPPSSSSWQTVVRQRLEERDARERAFDELIENYQRLARFAKQQSDRNASFLAAAGATKPAPVTTGAVGHLPSTTAGAAGAAAQSASKGSAGASSTLTATTTAKDTTDNMAVKQAYISSLESQLQSTRDELATLYKTQSQNAQRLLVLNEQMRTRDERERESSEDTRRNAEELLRVRRKEEDLRSVVGEKDKMIQILQDELSALSLELNQVEMRNDDLKRDNASLLQRWLDRMNDEADKMNDGNQFLQELDRRRTTAGEETKNDAV